jgi:hypothetical protein
VTIQPVRWGRGSAAAIAPSSVRSSSLSVERWAVDLAVQDGELVAEDDDLEVSGATGADRETGEHGDEAVENAEHS